MIWFILVPFFYLFVATPIAAFRLLHRPRFRSACVGVIVMSLGLPVYELACLILVRDDWPLIPVLLLWLGVGVSAPIQLGLLTLALVPSNSGSTDRKDS